VTSVAPSGAAPATCLLEGRGLTVMRGERTVLRSVSLELFPGEILGILGPSGAGKSTLFRALTGEEPSAVGSVVMAGVDVSRWPLWRRARAGIGYIPQSPSVLWDLTPVENLRTFAALSGTSGGASASSDAEALLERVDLTHRRDVRAGQLSAGERRRLEFARALVTRPQALVCDEPFAGVDPAGAERLGRLLRSLAEDGVAVVLADHHVEEALRTCTRAMLMLDGEIAVEGTPEAFRDHETVRGRYLGTWQRSLPPPAP
jgi:lipopolysaccharide export system ATP-binding protein